jgi:hypothetical protein
MAGTVAEDHYGIVESPYYDLFVSQVNSINLAYLDKETNDNHDTRVANLKKKILT